MSSFWIENNKIDYNLKSLENNISADVCIIGAGIFGLTCAYYLSKQGLKVVVLDKSGISEKTTGHTTAKITSQHSLIYKYLIDSLGQNSAKQYLDANEQAIKNMKHIFESENIDCDFETQDSYVYTTEESELESILLENDAVNSLGFNSKFVTTSPLRLNILGAIQFPNQAQFNPIKYVDGLCDKILKNDGSIYTNTTVCDVQKEKDNYITYTKNNKIESKYVILASHYPFINFPGFYFLKMYQSTSYIIAVDTKTELFEGMYINTKDPTYSFRTAKFGDKRLLLIAGSDHKTGSNIDLSNSYNMLEQKAKELYKKCEVLYRWNTEDCITLDKIPYIGRFSNLMPNMFVGTGFKKWGVTSSNVAANIITDKILGKENEFSEVFSSTRMQPIKNREEIKNMIKESAHSLVLNKFKVPSKDIDSIKKNEGVVLAINTHKIGVYKDSSGNIFAVKPICTHLGCLLSWNNIDKTWDCPCHGSRFDYMGKNLYSPAVKDLEVVDVEIG